MKLGQICPRGNDPAEMPGAGDSSATSPLAIATWPAAKRRSVLSRLDSHLGPMKRLN